MIPGERKKETSYFHLQGTISLAQTTSKLMIFAVMRSIY